MPVRYLLAMRTILNDSELEELLSNEWNSLMVEISEAKPLHVWFSEPSDGAQNGTWAWSDDRYHVLVVESGEDTEWTTTDLDEFTWRLFSRPLAEIAVKMDGDEAHNVVELASIIGPACRRKAQAALKTD